MNVIARLEFELAYYDSAVHGNLKRETKSLLIAIQNNSIRTNYVKAKINKSQKKNNSKFRLCNDRDETINHIISEYRDLAYKEYKTRQETSGWVGDPLVWLVAWVLWHINLCRLFNAKSIFIQIVSSISNHSV